ncbi:MAG TPA: sulfotransferase [Acidimicrobiia bacterium]
MPTSAPTSIVLLGMHRSGTSALAHSLHELGAWLGSPEYITRRSEHVLVQSCNQVILERLGGHWSAPPELVDGWTTRPEIVALDADARAAVGDLALASPSLWKDPRTCLTLDFWRARLQVEPIVVVSYRHPLEVAASLDRRNSFGPGHVVALWERYNRALLQRAAGLRCVVVAYADLVRAPEATLTSVCDRLGEFGVEFSRTPAEAAGAVDADRRHHVFADLPDDVTTPQQRALWEALGALPAESAAFVPPALPEPHAASCELLAARAATIRTERELVGARADLRSRRALGRALALRLRPSEWRS